MKKKDLVEYRKKTIDELKAKVIELKREVIDSYAKVKAGQEKNLRKPTNTRRDVARLLTIVKEKELSLKEGGNS